MRADVDTQVARIEAIWADCRARFGAGGPFLFGTFGAADCMFAPVVTRFVTYPVSLSRASKTYVDSVMAHPFMQDWVNAAQTEAMENDSYEQLPDGVAFLP